MNNNSINDKKQKNNKNNDTNKGVDEILNSVRSTLVNNDVNNTNNINQNDAIPLSTIAENQSIPLNTIAENQYSTNPTNDNHTIPLNNLAKNQPPTNQPPTNQPPTNNDTKPIPLKDVTYNTPPKELYKHFSENQNIISENTLNASQQAFAKLQKNINQNNTTTQNINPKTKDNISIQTLEDIVLKSLRPILKQWLDENLPNIVNELVEKEIQKINNKKNI